MNENQDIHKLIDEIVIAQSRMTKKERLKRFAASLYPESLDFVKEIDGTKYIVRTFFNKDAYESVYEKIKESYQKNNVLAL
ncbi:MAG: hypothetical protein ACI4QR_00970 [Eubacteriales bacterium]